MLYNFAQWKGPRQTWKLYLQFFLKKDLIQRSFVILAKKRYIPLTFWICSQVFFLILHNKRGCQELHEISFLRKNLIWWNVIFLGYFLLFDWVWSNLNLAIVNIGSLNSQDMISFIITTGSWNSEGMIRILKWSGHRFSTFIWWTLYGYYVMFICRGQYSIEGRTILWKSFFKNFLHNFIWMKRSLNAKNW